MKKVTATEFATGRQFEIKLKARVGDLNLT